MAPGKETPTKKATKINARAATKANKKENYKNGESFNKFDLLEDKESKNFDTFSNKFDLLK